MRMLAGTARHGTAQAAQSLTALAPGWATGIGVAAGPLGLFALA